MGEREPLDIESLRGAAEFALVTEDTADWHLTYEHDVNALCDEVERLCAENAKLLRQLQWAQENNHKLCGYCGALAWTIERYQRSEPFPGNVVHKHSCPNRRDAYCQTHPEGCPVEDLRA